MSSIRFITQLHDDTGDYFFARFALAVTYAQEQWPDAEIEIDADIGRAIVRDSHRRPIATLQQVELRA